MISSPILNCDTLIKAVSVFKLDSVVGTQFEGDEPIGRTKHATCNLGGARIVSELTRVN